MHLKILRIKGIRAFKELEWDIPYSRLKGWHVIIGDNGAGKSTFLRSISLALCGPKDIQALRENWSNWVRDDFEDAQIEVAVDYQPQWDKWGGRGTKLQNFYPSCGVRFRRINDSDGISVDRMNHRHDPDRHLWSKKSGWFSAAYGPFRRFSGGDPEEKKLFYSHPFLARHLTIFGENIALTEALEWLQQLRFEQLDGNDDSSNLIDFVTAFVNQSQFLPHGVTFEKVTSKSVLFRNPEGIEMDVVRLSDGFRSILSLTFELIRQLAHCYGVKKLFKTNSEGRITVNPPGIVLIDEIDAHLHPTWQRKIGNWLTTFFPNLQFIVTTHSPLVCQAADKGTIFRLPAPGGKTDIRAGFVEGSDRERLVHGDVLDAYGTELFGAGVNRSETAKEGMAELARLNQKTLKKKLTTKESERRNLLQKTYSSHAPTK